MPGAAGGAARLLHPPGALQRRPQPPPPEQREGAAGSPAPGAGADPPPGMEFLDINFTKDLSLMLHAIHSLSTTSGFLKKTRLYSGFKNTFKKSAKREKLESVRE
jgi:hypothetical protein